MAAGVRLSSPWGLGLLACLVLVHFDNGVGLPLRGGEGGQPGGLELLQVESSPSILDELAEAERVGSGEAAYEGAQASGGSQQFIQQPSPSGGERLAELPVNQVSNAVGKAAQVDLLSSLSNVVTGKSLAQSEPSSTDDMFSRALHNWDADKKSVIEASSQRNNLLSTDLGDQMEVGHEQNVVESIGSPKSPTLTPLTAQAVPDPAAESLEHVKHPQEQHVEDPLAEFQKEFEAGLNEKSPSDPSALNGDVQGLTSQVNTLTREAEKPSSPKKVQKTPDNGQNWLTSALAGWNDEANADIDVPLSTPVQKPAVSKVLPAIHVKSSDESSDVGDNGDLGESNDVTSTTVSQDQDDDLGESDGVDQAAAAATQGLDSEIEAEAQDAASQVVQSTMKDVERDFLYTEKAITRKLGENAPKITLEALDNADKESKHEKVKRKAAKAHKEMVHKAEQNYELAMASVHKDAQEQLANELAGLKLKLTQEEDKILGESKMKEQKAREEMEDIMRTRTTGQIEKVKAQLPAKLASIKTKAESQAREVASVAIQQITQGARKVRMKLRKDLGEAAGRVHAAERALASADKNPSLALKSAVDVRTEKAKYRKLHDLAESALTQQKGNAAKKIQKAQENAKESVRLAIKDAETKELKEARGQLASEQKKIQEEEQKKLEAKVARIKDMAKEKINAEREKFKKLVDAAVKLAPEREKELSMKAKVGLHKAKIAAKAYEEQLLSSLAPHTVDGKTITKEMAAECVKNPAGCDLFTLKGENSAAAAKFAESKARKAKRAQEEAKKEVTKALEKLRVTTNVAREYAQNARDADEKETRIRLAKLQLNEARAAAAFHSAAKAHLQTQLAHTKMSKDDDDAASKLKQFQQALSEMKVTHDESTVSDAEKAKAERETAFQKAREAAKALLKASAPP